MAVDFNPMLARNLVKELSAKEAAYGLGQQLGGKGFYPGKYLGKGMGLLGEAIAGMPSKIKKGLGNISSGAMRGLEGIHTGMTDDEGWFQGGMHDRMFGRPQDEMDIMKSKLGGLLKNLPYKPQGQGMPTYKNGQIVPTPGQDPNARPVPNTEMYDSTIDEKSKEYHQNYSPMFSRAQDMPGLDKSPLKWNRETATQDEIMKNSVEGRYRKFVGQEGIDDRMAPATFEKEVEDNSGQSEPNFLSRMFKKYHTDPKTRVKLHRNRNKSNDIYGGFATKGEFDNSYTENWWENMDWDKKFNDEKNKKFDWE